MKEHLDKDHIELAYLSEVSESQRDLGNKFECFKKELTDILNVIIDDHNAIKQELFIQRQDKNQVVKKMDNIEGAILGLTKALRSTDGEVRSESLSKATNSSPTIPLLSPVSPREPASATLSPASYAEVVSKTRPPNKAPPKTTPSVIPSQSASRVCVIGDSISGHLDRRVIADAMDAEVRAVRAYSSLKRLLK